MITIKELAQELGVSEQALRQWCKRNEIKKTTKGKVTSYFLDENTVELIRNHYTAQRKQGATNTQRKSNETLDLLQAQLAEKDKQISALSAQVQSLIADAAAERDKERNERQAILTQLFSLQADNKELQTELNKYKAIAERVVEVEPKEQAPTPEPEPENELAEDHEPQKLSFFQRLFRKRSE